MPFDAGQERGDGDAVVEVVVLEVAGGLEAGLALIEDVPPAAEVEVTDEGETGAEGEIGVDADEDGTAGVVNGVEEFNETGVLIVDDGVRLIDEIGLAEGTLVVEFDIDADGDDDEDELAEDTELGRDTGGDDGVIGMIEEIMETMELAELEMLELVTGGVPFS